MESRARSTSPIRKVDIAAVNPWMLRMAGEVADGVHVHPLGEPGYLARHVLPELAKGAARAGRRRGELTVIVPALTIVGDTDEESPRARERARMSLSFYGSTPNYAFIWDEAGFEGTTARCASSRRRATSRGWPPRSPTNTFSASPPRRRGTALADALVAKYGGIVDRLVLYNAADETPERFARYGEVARSIVARHPD